jgi:Flp pilus assembly protein TadG
MKLFARRSLQDFLAARRGAAALEFALVGLAYFPLCLGVFEVGLLLWTRSALITTANLTARCVAISSPSCTNAAQYAVTTAGNWLPTGTLTSSGVAVQTSSSCSGASGTMVKVTVTSTGFSTLPVLSGLATTALTANACYPVSP